MIKPHRLDNDRGMPNRVKLRREERGRGSGERRSVVRERERGRGREESGRGERGPGGEGGRGGANACRGEEAGGWPELEEKGFEKGKKGPSPISHRQEILARSRRHHAETSQRRCGIEKPREMRIALRSRANRRSQVPRSSLARAALPRRLRSPRAVSLGNPPGGSHYSPPPLRIHPCYPHPSPSPTHGPWAPPVPFPSLLPLASRPRGARGADMTPCAAAARAAPRRPETTRKRNVPRKCTQTRVLERAGIATAATQGPSFCRDHPPPPCAGSGTARPGPLGARRPRTALSSPFPFLSWATTASRRSTAQQLRRASRVRPGADATQDRNQK